LNLQNLASKQQDLGLNEAFDSDHFRGGGSLRSPASAARATGNIDTPPKSIARSRRAPPLATTVAEKSQIAATARALAENH
jgi:hypothetical protein